MRNILGSMVRLRMPSIPSIGSPGSRDASEVLKARARQMRDDFVLALAAMLAEEVDRPKDDADAYLGATLITSTWSIAFARAHALLSDTGDALAARRTFLNLIDRGTIGTRAALSGTRYT